MTIHHSKSTAASDPAFSSWQQKIESMVCQVSHLSADLLIDAIEQTSRVLRHTEQLGEQIIELLHKLEKERQAFRHFNKTAFKEIIHDSVEIASDVIQGVVQITHSVLDEAIEIGRRGKQLREHVQDSFQELSHPLKYRSMRKSQSKEPTIIPISIQDN